MASQRPVIRYCKHCKKFPAYGTYDYCSRGCATAAAGADVGGDSSISPVGLISKTWNFLKNLEIVLPEDEIKPSPPVTARNSAPSPALISMGGAGRQTDGMEVDSVGPGGDSTQRQRKDTWEASRDGAQEGDLVLLSLVNPTAEEAGGRLPAKSGTISTGPKAQQYQQKGTSEDLENGTKQRRTEILSSVNLGGPADREQTPPKSEASCSEAHRPGDTTKKQRPVKSGTGSEAQERSHQNRQVEISGTPEFGSTRGDSATPSQASRKGGPAGKRNAQAIRKAQIFSQENDRKDASPALNGGAKSRGTAVPSRAHPPDTTAGRENTEAIPQAQRYYLGDRGKDISQGPNDSAEPRQSRGFPSAEPKGMEILTQVPARLEADTQQPIQPDKQSTDSKGVGGHSLRTDTAAASYSTDALPASREAISRGGANACPVCHTNSISTGFKNCSRDCAIKQANQPNMNGPTRSGSSNPFQPAFTPPPAHFGSLSPPPKPANSMNKDVDAPKASEPEPCERCGTRPRKVHRHCSKKCARAAHAGRKGSRAYDGSDEDSWLEDTLPSKKPQQRAYDDEDDDGWGVVQSPLPQQPQVNPGNLKAYSCCGCTVTVPSGSPPAECPICKLEEVKKELKNEKAKPPVGIRIPQSPSGPVPPQPPAPSPPPPAPAPPTKRDQPSPKVRPAGPVQQPGLRKVMPTPAPKLAPLQPKPSKQTPKTPVQSAGRRLDEDDDDDDDDDDDMDFFVRRHDPPPTSALTQDAKERFLQRKT